MTSILSFPDFEGEFPDVFLTDPTPLTCTYGAGSKPTQGANQYSLFPSQSDIHMAQHQQVLSTCNLTVPSFLVKPEPTLPMKPEPMVYPTCEFSGIEACMETDAYGSQVSYSLQMSQCSSGRMMPHAQPVAETVRELNVCEGAQLPRPEAKRGHPETKQESRRRRNREASSRCYYNRKQRIYAKQKELEGLRQRSETLYRRMVHLQCENTRLKNELLVRSVKMPKQMRPSSFTSVDRADALLALMGTRGVQKRE